MTRDVSALDLAPAYETPRAASDVRFGFGDNWARFLSGLNAQRIGAAEASLQQMLRVEDLIGRRFLDIGSGSGLFSLAARRLGARVRSFDVDPQSVACTAELRRRYYPGDPDWIVTAGSALDRDFLAALGAFDIVYAWGVLHHTGEMWRALDLVRLPVAPSGRLFLAIYNDQGSATTRWRHIKRVCVGLPRPLQAPFAVLVCAPGEVRSLARALWAGQARAWVDRWRGRHRARGMSRWHDIVDWVGGYPYEAARADEIFSFYRDRGFSLEGLRMGRGLGCNEFVFGRPPADARP